MTTIVERISWTSIWKKWRSGSTGRSTATSEEAENTFKLWTFSQWRRWWWSISFLHNIISLITTSIFLEFIFVAGAGRLSMCISDGRRIYVYQSLPINPKLQCKIWPTMISKCQNMSVCATTRVIVTFKRIVPLWTGHVSCVVKCGLTKRQVSGFHIRIRKFVQSATWVYGRFREVKVWYDAGVKNVRILGLVSVLGECSLRRNASRAEMWWQKDMENLLSAWMSKGRRSEES